MTEMEPMTPAAQQAWLDLAVSPHTPHYDPRTGRLAMTNREMVKALEGPRHVVKSFIRWRKNRQLWVSTVHLVIDHNWARGYSWNDVDLDTPDDPIVYETMVFGHTDHFDALTDAVSAEYGIGDFQARYCTVAQARQGHEDVCKAITRVLIRQRYTVVRHDPVDGLIDPVDPITNDEPPAIVRSVP